MPNAEQLQALSRCLLDLHHLDLADARSAFIDRVFERYAQLVPHDAGLWSGGRMSLDPGVGPVMHYIHLHRMRVEELLPIWEHRSSAAERARFSSFMAANVNRAQAVHGATPGLEAAFAQLFGCRGIRHLLGIYLFDPSVGLFNIISLYRTGDTPFTEAERLLHELAAPHIFAVLRKHSLGHIGVAAPGTGAAAVADLSGTLHHAHPEFIRLVQEEWPGWQGPGLPADILPGSRLPAQPLLHVGSRVVVQAEMGGELYRFHARRKARIDELTPREREVAALFASRSYKEVARELGIAPSTVRNIIGSIYGKLGVSDKGKFAQLLAEHERPGA